MVQYPRNKDHNPSSKISRDLRSKVRDCEDLRLSGSHFGLAGVQGSSIPVGWSEEALMRRTLALFSLFAFTLTLVAQSPAPAKTPSKLAPPQAPKVQLAAQQVLPVRKVVLY